MAKPTRGTSEKKHRGKGLGIRAVSRAFRILRSLGEEREAKSLAELSREHGLHKTTCLRLLRTLASAGIVAQEPATGRYFRAPAFWMLLSPFTGPTLSFLRDVRSLLDTLSGLTGATSVIIFPDGTGRNCMPGLYCVPPRPVRLEPSFGRPTPLHATAAGKCYLSDLPPAELDDYLLRGLERVTEHTVTSARALRRELAAARRQGYALSRGEAISRSPGIAVPLRDEDGTVFAGLSLAFVEREFNEEELLQHLPLLKSTAADISKLLTHDSVVRYIREAGQEPILLPREPVHAVADRDNRSLVRSVTRAIGIIGVLWNSRSAMPISELARQRGLDDSTVQRLVHTLAAEGIIRREAAGKRYHIDPVLWLRLAPFILGATSLQETIAFVLQRLAHHSGATAGLLCPDPTLNRAVVSAFEVPPSPVHFRPPPDDHPPLHATAAGKSCLAACSASRIERYVAAGLEVRTEHTIATVDRLQQELAAVREQGYAISREESTPSICGLAVPVRSSAGDVVCAVSLAPVVSSFTEDSIQRWLPQLRVAAQALSQVLTPGWSRILLDGQSDDSEAASTQDR